MENAEAHAAIVAQVRAEMAAEAQAYLQDAMAEMRAQIAAERAAAAAEAAAAAPVAAAPVAAAAAAADHARNPRPPMKWPEWAGNPELLPAWRSQVLSKIRNDVGALPDPEGIIGTIQQ